MILDTSAIIGILNKESDLQALLNKMRAAGDRAVSTPILVESSLVLTRRRGDKTEADLSWFMQSFKIRILPFERDHWREAAKAFRRFGKGRHPAALNFGDCMAYATAKVAGLPLLCLGDDFSKTDLDLA